MPHRAGQVVTWTLNRATFRLEDAPEVLRAYQVQLERSPSGGAFVATVLATLSLDAGVNEVTATSFNLATVQSGQLMRINWVQLGTGVADWSVQLEGTEV